MKCAAKAGRLASGIAVLFILRRESQTALPKIALSVGFCLAVRVALSDRVADNGLRAGARSLVLRLRQGYDACTLFAVVFTILFIFFNPIISTIILTKFTIDHSNAKPKKDTWSGNVLLKNR